MESITYLKNLDIAPKKLRMLLPKVKKMSPSEAVNVLFYSPRKSGQVFYKAIKSAISNAKQTLKVNDDLLQFKLFTIEEGNKLKRYNAGSRGSAKPFKKRYSHIKIILTSRPAEQVIAKKTTKADESKKMAKKEDVKAEAQQSVEAPKTKKTAVKKAAKKSAAKKASK